MKKHFLFALLLSVLLLSFASSVEITSKDSVKRGENFIIHITGDFYQPLTKENVMFYRRHMSTSMEPYSVYGIGGDYYISVLIPLEKIPDTYSINISGVKYAEGTGISTLPFSKSFIVLDEIVPFSINPPLQIVQSDYSVQLINNLDLAISIDLGKKIKTVEEITSTGESVESGGFLDTFFGLFESTSSEEPSSNQVFLSAKETKTLNFNQPEKQGFETLEFIYEDSAYATLVYAPEDKVVKEEIIEEPEDIKEVTEEEEVPENPIDDENITVEENNTTDDGSWFSNLFKTKDQNKTETETEIENISEDYNITYEENGSININGITFTDEPENESLPPTSEESENIDTSTEEYQEGLKSCQALGGKVCTPNEETCDGDMKYSSSVKCCIGQCLKIEKSSKTKIIGWILAGVIVIFVIWLIKRKSKAAPVRPNLLKIGKRRY